MFVETKSSFAKISRRARAELCNERSAMSNNNHMAIPAWKRALDVIAILLALPCVLPVAVVIALVIRATSAGPILFQQERVGCRGRRFMCLKFRTMFCGAETATHQGHLKNLMDADVPMVKMDARGDARIIPFGKILRSAGLDELPQLINVLKGEMSLVGPRPCLPYEAEQYLPWQQERFNAAPGLTGLWQVSGKNRTTFTKMIQLDIEYSRRKNLWLDLVIIFKTVPALLVQMWDMRQQKKSRVPATVSAESALPARLINQ
jgi:lipopolysaccharide/colanic/teichoic acid biosynthesis glycosyltransferase